MGDLKAAIQNVGGELGRRFLAKLQGSQPIVSMALGSSFFYDSAGCFDNGLDSFTKIGIVSVGHFVHYTLLTDSTSSSSPRNGPVTRKSAKTGML